MLAEKPLALWIEPWPPNLDLDRLGCLFDRFCRRVFFDVEMPQ